MSVRPRWLVGVGVPLVDVVGFAPVDGGLAAGEGAVPRVAEPEGPSLGSVGEADVLAGVEDLAVGGDDEAVEVGAAEEPAERGGVEGGAVGVLADPASWRRRGLSMGRPCRVRSSQMTSTEGRGRPCLVPRWPRRATIWTRAWPRRSAGVSPSSGPKMPTRYISSTSASMAPRTMAPCSASISPSRTKRPSKVCASDTATRARSPRRVRRGRWSRRRGGRPGARRGGTARRR